MARDSDNISGVTEQLLSILFIIINDNLNGGR